MSEQPGKLLRGLTLVTGIIFLVIGILVLFISVVIFQQYLGGSPAIGKDAFLTLFLGLIFTGVGIGLLVYYFIKSS